MAICRIVSNNSESDSYGDFHLKSGLLASGPGKHDDLCSLPMMFGRIVPGDVQLFHITHRPHGLFSPP